MNTVILTKPIITFLLSILLNGGHSAGNAEVTYIPVTASEGVFHVVYNNTTGSRFVVQILDQDGDQLYQKTFTDASFTRDFQLADPDSYSKLIFVIRNLGDHSSQRFEVEANARLVENVSVQEVK